MPTINLKPLQHRGQECIGIFFDNHAAINGAIRKKAGARWSQTQKCWYVPLSKEQYNKLCFAVKGLADIDHAALQQYLSERKKQAAPVVPVKKNPPVPVQQTNTVVSPAVWEQQRVVVYKKERISPVNAHVLPAMEEHLKLKAYSPSTIRTYLGEMSLFLMLLRDIPADRLAVAHLKRYFVYCFEKLGLKENTLHSRINAMKFYYEQVLGRDKFFWEIPRPKKQLILPKVLSDAEIGRMFRAISNLKHKAILFTAYSAGLRVSEVVNLKLSHIDSARMTLFIEKAKGKKDRVVNLSPLLLDILRSYIRQSDPRPKKYLFEGEVPGQPYSIRSAQLIFLDARKKAGISKEVSFHALRHSFATHLLEKGVDIRYIKDILGHFNIKTTERYTHVSRRALVNIISPLDDLFSKGIL